MTAIYRTPSTHVSCISSMCVKYHSLSKNSNAVSKSSFCHCHITIKFWIDRNVYLYLPTENKITYILATKQTWAKLGKTRIDGSEITTNLFACDGWSWYFSRALWMVHNHFEHHCLFDCYNRYVAVRIRSRLIAGNLWYRSSISNNDVLYNIKGIL